MCVILFFVKSIIIGGHQIRIKWADLDNMYGCYDEEKRTIYLDNEIKNDPDETRATLRHEMQEASLFISGVAWMEKYDQEAVIRAMDNIFWPAWERIGKMI